jgi:hypothetical protein
MIAARDLGKGAGGREEKQWQLQLYLHFAYFNHYIRKRRPGIPPMVYLLLECLPALWHNAR